MVANPVPFITITMKKLLFLLLFTPLYSIAQSGSIYESVWEKLAGLYRQGLLDSVPVSVSFFKNDFGRLHPVELCYRYRDTACYTDGYMAAGYTVFNTRHAEGRELMTGVWTYYYPSGSIYAQGEYGIGAFMDCQSGGPAGTYYNYKVGPWTYWYENGKLLTRGNYVPGRATWRNSCGTDTVLQSAVNHSWKFYDSTGNDMPEVDRSIIDKINTRHEGTLYLYILRAPELSAGTPE